MKNLVLVLFCALIVAIFISVLLYNRNIAPVIQENERLKKEVAQADNKIDSLINLNDSLQTVADNQTYLYMLAIQKANSQENKFRTKKVIHDTLPKIQTNFNAERNSILHSLYPDSLFHPRSRL